MAQKCSNISNRSKTCCPGGMLQQLCCSSQRNKRAAPKRVQVDSWRRSSSLLAAIPTSSRLTGGKLRSPAGSRLVSQHVFPSLPQAGDPGTDFPRSAGCYTVRVRGDGDRELRQEVEGREVYQPVTHPARQPGTGERKE